MMPSASTGSGSRSCLLQTSVPPCGNWYGWAARIGMCCTVCFRKRRPPALFLQSRDFMELFKDICLQEYPYVAYADAFHTMRSMLLPVLYLLTGRVPKADVYHAISTGYGGLLACMGGSLNHAPVLLTEHGIYTREREEEIIRAEWVVPRSRVDGSDSSICFQRRFTGGRSGSAVCSIMPAGRRSRWGCNAEKVHRHPKRRPVRAVLQYPAQTGGWLGGYRRSGASGPIKDVKTMIYAFFELASPDAQCPAPHYGRRGR